MDLIKLIHWEHNPAAIGRMRKPTSLQLSLGTTRTNDHDSLTGFFCRWRCRLFTENGQLFGCVAEQVFRLDCKSMPPQLLKVLIMLSFNSFESLMKIRLDKVGLRLNLNFQPDDNQISEFLAELNRI